MVLLLDRLFSLHRGRFDAGCMVAGMVAISGLMLAMSVSYAWPRDLDGRYAQSPLHDWFEKQHSKKGAWCCSEADGETNIEWRTAGDHYQVFLLNRWVDVPDEALVEGKNAVGKAIVWPIYAHSGVIVRCFMPGDLS